MYLYFDTAGNLKEQINDNALRQGNSNINKLYVYWEKSVNNANITALWARFKSDESTYYPSSTTWMSSTTSVNETIPYDKNRDLKYFNYFTTYKFYVITLPDEVLGVSGSWLGTLQFVETNAITTLGQLAFYVSESNASVEADENINIAQWNYLIKMVSDLKEEYDGFVTESELENYVTINNVNQTIDGNKTFTKYTTFNDGLYSANFILLAQNKDLEINNGYRYDTIPTRTHLKAETNSTDSDDVTLYLPNKDGTLATTDDINTALGTVYKIKGSGSVSTINASLALVTDKATWNGYVYNVIDSGDLTNYSGTTSVVAGDNVVFVYTSGTNWGWDKLAGTIDTSNFVTLNGTQDISGKKTFTNASGVYLTEQTSTPASTDGLQAQDDDHLYWKGTKIPLISDVPTNNNQLTNGAGYQTQAQVESKIAEGVPYLTTAPSSANTSGKLKFVVLDSEPSTYYDGYYYIITQSTTPVTTYNTIHLKRFWSDGTAKYKLNDGNEVTLSTSNQELTLNNVSKLEVYMSCDDIGQINVDTSSFKDRNSTGNLYETSNTGWTDITQYLQEGCYVSIYPND